MHKLKSRFGGGRMGRSHKQLLVTVKYGTEDRASAEEFTGMLLAKWKIRRQLKKQ
jgi:hypothetical protein